MEQVYSMSNHQQSKKLSRREVLAGSVLAGVGLGITCQTPLSSQQKLCAQTVPLTPSRSVGTSQWDSEQQGSLATDSLQRTTAQSAVVQPFYTLNTGTLLGFNLGIEEEIDIAAETGYLGIELWMFKISQFLDKGGTLLELRKRLEDHNIRPVNGIGFAEWMNPDEAKRQEAFGLLKREMDQLAQLNCPYIAAPPSGPAYSNRIDDWQWCGDQYRAIIELGATVGVLPLLELWGRSQTLSRLSDAAAVAIAAGDVRASLLLDVFHLFRGNNRFESLTQINPASLRVFHLNDYPAEPNREEQTDADRIYPGDGVGPMDWILQTLYAGGFQGALSLELFNKHLWETSNPREVAQTGLAKMKICCQTALNEF